MISKVKVKFFGRAKHFYICGFANGACLRNVWPFQGNENSLGKMLIVGSYYCELHFIAQGPAQWDGIYSQILTTCVAYVYAVVVLGRVIR